jgi:hypothetical protein
MKEEHSELPDSESEKPPILGSWNNLYYFLVGTLVVQIILYYLITISFE